MKRSIFRSVLRASVRNRTVRMVELTIIYAVTLAVCLWTAYGLRFDFNVPQRFDLPVVTMLVILGLKLLALFAFNQFDGRLTHFGRPDLKRLVIACTVGSLPFAAISVVPVFGFGLPRGVIPIDLILCIVALSIGRYGLGHLRSFAFSTSEMPPRRLRRVGIVGAGDAGALLARHLLGRPSLRLQPVAFFDDDCRRRSSVHGIPVVGTPERIEELRVKFRIEEMITRMSFEEGLA